MSIIVEDGTGLANSNSYASVAEADAYFSLRGVATWTGTDAAKEQSLVRATSSIDGLYNSRWPGQRSKSDQALGWPRGLAWDLDGFPLTLVPASVKVATMEAALLELVTPGALSPSFDRGGAIIKEKVGLIELTYSEAASPGTTYNTIRQALSRIIRAGGGVVFRRG